MKHILASIRSVALPVAIGILLGACDDATGPSGPSGTYVLSHIHGIAIPQYFTSPTVPGTDGYRTLYTSSTIRIEGTEVDYTLEKSMEWPALTFTDVTISETAELVLRPDGRYMIRKLEEVFPGQPPVATLVLHITTWSADSMVVSGEAAEMLYRRQ